MRTVRRGCRGLMRVAASIALLNALQNSAGEQTPAPAGSASTRPITAEMLERALSQPYVPIPGDAVLDREMPLQKFLEAAALSMARAVAHPVPVIPDDEELLLDGIRSLNEVIVHVPPVDAGVMTSREMLDYMLSQTSDPELGYSVREGHILISTVAALESDDQLQLRVYDVGDLIPVIPKAIVIRDFHQEMDAALSVLREEDEQFQRPKTLRRGKGPKIEQDAAAALKQLDVIQRQLDDSLVIVDVEYLARTSLALRNATAVKQRARERRAKLVQLEQLPPLVPNPDVFLQLIMDHSGPVRWFDVDGEGGRLELRGRHLFITQSYAAHRSIAELLNSLRDKVRRHGPTIQRVSGLQFRRDFPGAGFGTGYFLIR